MMMKVAAFGMVLGCATMSFAQAAAPSKAASDDALYTQTIEKISKTNDLFAAKKVSFDKTRQQQTNSGKPDDKIVCQSLAGWNLIFQDRIGNYTELIEMRRQGKFTAHLTNIDALIASIKLDLLKNQTNFDQIAGIYKCELSGVRSDGSFNFSWSFDLLPEGAKFEDFLEPSDVAVAEDLIVQGYLDAAIKSLNAFIKAHPTNYDALTQRAIAVYFKNYLGVYDRNRSDADQEKLDLAFAAAGADAEEAIKLDPQNILAYWILGEIYDKQPLLSDQSAAKTKMAFGLAEKAIAQNPKRALNYYIRGRMGNEYGNTEVGDFTKAIELDPNLTNAYYGRGAGYSAHKNYYEALADFNKVIEKSPRSITAHKQRGTVYYHLGEIDKATADLRRAVEFDPANQDLKALLKKYGGPVDNAELIDRFKYLSSVLDKSVAIENQLAAKYDQITKTQTDKTVICQSMTEMNAALQNVKMNLSKVLFINQHPEIAEFKGPISLFKPFADGTETTLTNINAEAAKRGCKLPVQ